MGLKHALIGSAAAMIAGVAVYAAPTVTAVPTARTKPTLAVAPRTIGGFTPASADPRLAAALSRAGLGSAAFRFTPSESRAEGNRAVTVAVRTSRINGGGDRTDASPAAVSMAPTAYNLGAAVGWKHFALSGGVTKVDLGAQPGSREAFDLGVSYVGKRATARVKAGGERPLAETPQTLDGLAGYSLDVGGSYSVTRNIDVTAGVRYRTENDRLERMRDTRRDSQAVYVGTAFRF